ncbi:hypothetical protein ACFLTK_01610 [Chloroflexota bacterium]
MPSNGTHHSFHWSVDVDYQEVWILDDTMRMNLVETQVKDYVQRQHRSMSQISDTLHSSRQRVDALRLMAENLHGITDIVAQMNQLEAHVEMAVSAVVIFYQHAKHDMPYNRFHQDTGGTGIPGYLDWRVEDLRLIHCQFDRCCGNLCTYRQLHPASGHDIVSSHR